MKLNVPYNRDCIETMRKIVGGGRVIISNLIPKTLHISADSNDQIKRAAILIPLINVNRKPSILFQLRSSTVGTHPSQVSFPGGHIDTKETAIEASLREFHEELGCDITNDVVIIGECQTIPAITKTLVTPIIAYISKDYHELDIKPNASEVERVFTRSLEELTDVNRNKEELLQRDNKSMKFPVFGINDNDEKIWGLTALVLNSVLQKVILPGYNTHNY